jgi:phosphoribosylformylglycinamidine synthase
LVEAVRGIGEACRALDFPIVSGNVSLYNETNGRGVLPTPTIGGVGLIEAWSKTARVGFAAPGQPILLVGAPEGWGTLLGQSTYLRELFCRSEGPAPFVDLAHERKVGDFVRDLIVRGVATAVHDLSDGGLAVALAEMALASGLGAGIDGAPGRSPAAVFFGEDQGRYLVTVRDADVDTVLHEAGLLGVRTPIIGHTGGDDVVLGNAVPVPLSALRDAYEGWFPSYMAGAIID